MRAILRPLVLVLVISGSFAANAKSKVLEEACGQIIQADENLIVVNDDIRGVVQFSLVTDKERDDALGLATLALNEDLEICVVRTEAGLMSHDSLKLPALEIPGL